MADEKKDLVISTVSLGESAMTDRTPAIPREKVLQSPIAQRITSAVNDVFPGAGGFTKQRSKEVWRTTFLRFSPLSGVFCMLLSLASLAASLGILAGSNHQPTASWSTSPSTYLAIFTAIANLSVRYASVQGIVISWWFQATRGSSLANLHWKWKAGTSLAGALFSGKRMGFLGLACVLSTVVVIDGPLLQRATKVVSAPAKDHPVPLEVSMAPEMPTGYSGSWSTAAELDLVDWHAAVQFNKTVPTPYGSIPNDVSLSANVSTSDVNSWADNLPLHNAIRGCPGRCKGKLRAPALSVSRCSTQSIPVNYSTTLTEKDRLFIDAPPIDHNAFLVVLALDISGETEAINLVTAFASIDSHTECTGQLTLKTCTLQSAIGEYNVTVDNGQTTLEFADAPKILALANNAQVDRNYNETLQGHPSTLGGIASITIALWEGSNVYYRTKGRTQGIWTGGVNYMRYIGSGTSNCPSYSDPTKAVLSSLNKMMVYVGASAAKEPSINSFLDTGLRINYTMTGYLEGDHNIYVTDYWYFLGAALVEVVCIALIAPTYWGWWRIGRACSFSPLEIAKAFQSPLLADCNSNSSGRSLARDTSGVEIRYGVQPADQSRTEPELAFGDSMSVVPPESGISYR